MSDKNDTRENVVTQVRGLSSGTLSYLIGCTLYSVIDEARAEFIEYVEETEAHYQSWQQAWSDYAKIKGYASN
jgi:hypothetical protein